MPPNFQLVSHIFTSIGLSQTSHNKLDICEAYVLPVMSVITFGASFVTSDVQFVNYTNT